MLTHLVNIFFKYKQTRIRGMGVGRKNEDFEVLDAALLYNNLLRATAYVHNSVYKTREALPGNQH